MMWVWILIVVVVIAALVFITIKYKNNPPVSENTQAVQDQNTNMPTQTQEGVKITVLKEGTGAVAKSGDTVAMNYTGMLTDGTVFDSNIDPKFNHVQPFIFTLGAGQVIPGWDQGIAGMKVGEQRKLEILPELAYGANGITDPSTKAVIIPPNATLTFTVELLGIK